MKPRRANVRKTAKWSALVLGLVLVAAGAVSTVWRCQWTSGGSTGFHNVELVAGRIGYEHDTVWVYVKGDSRYGRSWNFSRQSEWARWLPQYRARPFFKVYLPLWLPAFGAFGVGAALWRWDVFAMRRARAGLCPVCSYDRAGISPSSPCPECGKAMV